jgi:membrane-bound serine protease (ClpP class)
MSGLLWVVALAGLGLVVMVLEVFVPSGGILGVLSLLAIVAAVATAFFELGVTAGMIVTGVVVVAVPAVLALAFRWFPETSLGRRVLPPVPDGEDVLPGLDRRRLAQDLVGQSGRTVSELLPWGRAEFAGRVVDAVSEGGPLEAGTAVTAVGTQGMAVVVRPVEQARPVEPVPPAESAPSSPQAPRSPAGEGTSALSPTLETFEFDPLDPSL